MVPPSNEAFDSIECARRAAMLRGLDAAALTPVILPTLAVEPWESPVGPIPATPRKGLAALAAMLLVPSQAALAGGVGLATAGSAAAIYLAARPAIQPSHSDSVVTAMPAPKAPSSKPSTPAARPAARAPLPLAAKRPPDVRARKLVVGRRSRPLAGYAVVRNVVPTGRSTPGSSYSTSTNTQLVSRTIPARGTAPVSEAHAGGKGRAQLGACAAAHAALDADVDPEAAPQAEAQAARDPAHSGPFDLGRHVQAVQPRSQLCDPAAGLGRCHPAEGQEARTAGHAGGGGRESPPAADRRRRSAGRRPRRRRSGR